MNKYLKLHIDQATKATRRHYNVARRVAIITGMVIAAYAVMLIGWWCFSVATIVLENWLGIAP